VAIFLTDKDLITVTPMKEWILYQNYPSYVAYKALRAAVPLPYILQSTRILSGFGGMQYTSVCSPQRTCRAESEPKLAS
jgi:hypothetical protein